MVPCGYSKLGFPLNGRSVWEVWEVNREGQRGERGRPNCRTKRKPLWASFPFLSTYIDRTTPRRHVFMAASKTRVGRPQPLALVFTPVRTAPIIARRQDSLFTCPLHVLPVHRHSKEYAKMSNYEKSHVLLAFYRAPPNAYLRYTAKFALGKPEGWEILTEFANLLCLYERASQKFSSSHLAVTVRRHPQERSLSKPSQSLNMDNPTSTRQG